MAGSQLTIDTEDVWNLWNISLRLEMLCSSLENPGCSELKPPETALLERMRSRGGEITDRFLINFVEHQISRIEVRFTPLSSTKRANANEDDRLVPAPLPCVTW